MAFSAVAPLSIHGVLVWMGTYAVCRATPPPRSWSWIPLLLWTTILEATMTLKNSTNSKCPTELSRDRAGDSREQVLE